MVPIFGEKVKNQINYFDPPYAIRNNCQIGQWMIGDDFPVAKELEIAIIKVAKMYGDLGKTKNANWLQLWFIASPKEKKIPDNLVCVTYIKTRSINQLGMEVMKNMSCDVDPGVGLFKTYFIKHDGEKGKYYSLGFKWRAREASEKAQLKLIEEFLSKNLILNDSGIPNTLKEIQKVKEIEQSID